MFALYIHSVEGWWMNQKLVTQFQNIQNITQNIQDNVMQTIKGMQKEMEQRITDMIDGIKKEKNADRYSRESKRGHS
jgi:uncharacterized alkaline shock family protein YloU